MKRCPSCGKSDLRSGTVPHHLTVGEHRFSGRMQGEICNACNNSVVGVNDLVMFELGVGELLIRSGQASSSPEAFRFMRKSLGMRAVELADLLGVTLETVSMWENGKLPIETRSLALLGCMVIDAITERKITINLLRATRSPTKLTKTTLLLDGVNVWPDVP